VMYWIGHHFGRRVLRERAWWSRVVKPETEARVEQLIRCHGLKVFFVARFLVGLRSPVYLAAGVMHVPFRRFLFFDAICATTVIGTFFGLSYFLSEQFGNSIYQWIRDAELTATVIVVTGLVVLAFFWWRRHVRHRREQACASSQQSGQQPDDDEDDARSEARDVPSPEDEFEPVS